jgi:hypothetical protein
MTDDTTDTYGHLTTEGAHSALRTGLLLIAALLLGAVLMLLVLQFPELTGWTIERATDGTPSPI